MTTASEAVWWARGLLFENCSCNLVCPGHIHFSQPCTHERCRGYWAVRVDEGTFGRVALTGLRAVIVFDTPQRMIDGGWTEGLIIDESASAQQRAALEAILTGRAGGPWEVLNRFVGRRLDTRVARIVFEEDATTKRASIAGLLQTVLTQIRGRNRNAPVRFENAFNQIHAPSQVLALGDTTFDDGVIKIANRNSHGLFSNFDWAVSGRAS
jgi:hypothetical protein